MAKVNLIDEWSEIVEKNIHVTYPAVRPMNNLTNPVDRVKSGGQYRLDVRIYNTSYSVAVYFTKVAVRIVGEPTQVTFYTDESFNTEENPDNHGNPRKHLYGGYLSPGTQQTLYAYFKARKNQTTKTLKFKTGRYGDIRTWGGTGKNRAQKSKLKLVPPLEDDRTQSLVGNTVILQQKHSTLTILNCSDV